MERILAHYRVLCRADEAADMARAIAWEQTVEVVEAAVPWPDVRERMVGRLEELHHDGQAAHIYLSFNPELAVERIAPLFTLAYGNASLYPNVRLMGFRVPDRLASAIGGPRFGLDGIREATGIFDRPLLCTAIKPRGAPLEHLTDIAYRYALGGGDIIKDDQNLAETDTATFRRRVTAIDQALQKAADITGRRCLYFPHIYGAGSELHEQLECLTDLAIRGALFCPLNLGMATCKQAARDYNLIAMYHPAFAGAFTQPRDHGIAADVLYGTFYRLAGADISVFLGPGGRISLSAEENTAIHHKLIQPMGLRPDDAIKPTLPCPAGGKTLEQIPALIKLHGKDCLLLVGGALLTLDPDISIGTRRYIDTIQRHVPIEKNNQYFLKR